MRTLLMIDSVSTEKIPHGTPIVPAYVDGGYVNVTPVRERFPHAIIPTITVKGDIRAKVADREKGDLDPTQAARWALERITKLSRPATIYVSRAYWQQCQDAVRKEIPDRRVRKHVHWWIADWTGQPHLVRGSVATQYMNDVHRDLDYNLCAIKWPGVMTPMSRSHRIAAHMLSRGLSHRHEAVPPADGSTLRSLETFIHNVNGIGH